MPNALYTNRYVKLELKRIHKITRSGVPCGLLTKQIQTGISKQGSHKGSHYKILECKNQFHHENNIYTNNHVRWALPEWHLLKETLKNRKISGTHRFSRST